MSEIRDLAARLLKAAGDLRDVEATAERIGRIAKAGDDVRTRVEAATRPNALLTEMRKDMSVAPDNRVREAAARACAALGALRTEPENADAGRRFADAAKDVEVALREQARECWRAAANGSELAGRLALLTAIAKIPAFRDRARAAAELGGSVQRALTQDGASVQQYRLFREDLAEFQAAFAALDLGSAPHVTKFLLKSANGTATLADLTPAVRAWLRAEELEAQFAIRPVTT